MVVANAADTQILDNIVILPNIDLPWFVLQIYGATNNTIVKGERFTGCMGVIVEAATVTATLIKGNDFRGVSMYGKRRDGG